MLRSTDIELPEPLSARLPCFRSTARPHSTPTMYVLKPHHVALSTALRVYGHLTPSSPTESNKEIIPSLEAFDTPYLDPLDPSGSIHTDLEPWGLGTYSPKRGTPIFRYCPSMALYIPQNNDPSNPTRQVGNRRAPRRHPSGATSLTTSSPTSRILCRV